MEDSTPSAASHTLQTVAFTALFLAACLLFPQVKFWLQLSKLPLLDDSSTGKKQRTAYMQSAKRMYAEGYEKFKNGVYRLGTENGNDNVVLAPRFLAELKKLPDSVLSFPASVDEIMEVKYTGLISEDDLMIHSIKADLTPGLSRLNPRVYEEVKDTIRDDMPDCTDWTPVPIYMTLATMVAKISGRVFVGPELCRNKDYVDCAVNYTMDVMGVVREVKALNPWLKPIFAPRLAVRKRLQKREQQMAHDILYPVVRAREEAEAKDPNWEKPDDMLSWAMNRRKDYGGRSTEYMAKLQLGLIFAAVHTTTSSATNILYDLAARRDEYIQPLRDEIRTVTAAHNGTITTLALQQMVKLDSFMKESTRFHPIGITSFNRKVLQGFTLSNGQYIPPGVTVEVPSHAVYMDPTLYPDSATFDGFRFAKLREGGGPADNAKNQFVTTNEQNLNFGHGRHACPGRFFAANEIKMIVARMVMDFDFKNEGDSTERYPNIEMGRQSIPDPRKVLLFKKVEV